MNEDIYKCKFENEGKTIRVVMEEDVPMSSAKASYDSEKTPDSGIPETVLQYERQLRKKRAADKAGSLITKEEHLRIIYSDEYLVVTDKPSGVLCVPGVNNNSSLVTVVYEEFGEAIPSVNNMIIHRLDMDTSGLVVFGRTKDVVSKAHESFRKKEVEKTYEALVCGHVPFNDGTIDLPLQRDHERPPFMRVSTPRSEHDAAIVVKDLQHHGWKKILKKNPKPSKTEFTVIERSFYPGTKWPVTRLALIPITGRTHQLRVHCAALGHPIVADPAYGVYGEASANGGFSEQAMDVASPQRATLALQQQINTMVQKKGLNMCLHAKTLKLSHPISGDLLSFDAPTPF